jgi:lipoprotein-anchoring transpeptidase ErfK/SrfK
VAEQYGDGGVIGLHGTNQPELLGQDVSHGCIRVANDVITEMVSYLPLGTPVEIIP